VVGAGAPGAGGLSPLAATVSLISPAELAERLGGPRPPVVLDVRWPHFRPPDRTGFLAGHVPGSRFVDLDAELAAPPGGTRGGLRPLPGARAFSAAMCAHGVRRSRPVVVLDLSTGLSAARAWWCLRYFGHPDVRLLDGGFTAWAAAGLPVAAGEPDPVAPGDFRARPGGLPVLDAEATAVFPAAGLLLDARPAARYRGEDPADPEHGHIPGAISAPSGENVDAIGRWSAPERLAERYRALGAVGRPVAVYCGSTVTACHTVLAMTAAGLPAPALYVGSLSEWSAQGRPTTT
jgi:thiosulfate/3-mercaptopyruvate sulfurtransferase